MNVQAETQFRDNIDDIYQIYVRNAQGGMVPIRALAEAKLVQGPQTIVRYNGFRGAIRERRGQARLQLRRARRHGQRNTSAATLPPGYSFEWTGTALHEGSERTHGHCARSGRPVRVSLSGALYESWNIPIPVLLSVTIVEFWARSLRLCWRD